jgi:hypothetical protein
LRLESVVSAQSGDDVDASRLPCPRAEKKNKRRFRVVAPDVGRSSLRYLHLLCQLDHPFRSLRLADHTPQGRCEAQNTRTPAAAWYLVVAAPLSRVGDFDPVFKQIVATVQLPN